ncbi:MULTISPECIES: GntR family transcriptional regulator [Shimia]|uniref:GntR family transcriptional regulator n=1 Tax=Shimia TaxID=573139 RepID=UPI001FB41DD6|nr:MULTISPECIES: GntR family transcriptional regulator [Shimia]MDV4146280.1 GntR family transcriptional regulator [Shimia sp. FJ5]
MSTKTNPLRLDHLERRSLSQEIATLLTDHILSGRLRPGERVSESVIARELGVSRAPVREAGRMLESTGLLVSHPNRGFFVRTMNSEDLGSLYELRLAIEREAAALVVRKGAADVIPVLRQQLEKMIALADAGREPETSAADLEFHRLLIEASGNPRFLAIFQQISSEIQLGLSLIGRMENAPDNIASNHGHIIEALESGDVEQVRNAMDYHIGLARHVIVAHFSGLETADRD